MSHMQNLIDNAFHKWEHAEMKLHGQKPPLACSSDVACALPLRPKWRVRLRDALSRVRRLR